MTFAGVILGAGISLAAARYIEPLLFNDSARDPLVFGIVSATLLTVAVLAGAVPASRARRVDPIVALRPDQEARNDSSFSATA